MHGVHMSQSDIIRDIQTLDDGLLLSLAGEIDLSRSPEVRVGLIQQIESQPQRLVIDLADVPYMDSSGVATLVEALQKQRAHGGKMVLCNMQTRVRSIFEIARLDQVFTIVDDLQTAKTV
jgi:anti-sigma B factor antagonist